MKNKKNTPIYPSGLLIVAPWGATSPDRKIGKAITEPRAP